MTASTAQTSAPGTIPGFNTLLLGATGTGKTYSLRTLLDAGLEVFVLSTEPGIASTLGDTPPERLHWHYVAPATPGLAALLDSASKINQMSLDMLTKLKGVNKAQYNQYMQVLETLANFRDDRTGEAFGAVDSWDTSRVLVIDSLSGLNVMAMDLVVGSKPIKSMADWGIAVDNLERLLMMLCTGTQCHFILTGHLERETDEITGGITLTAATLGRKLGPRLPRFFDDVVMAKREGEQFAWSTAAMNVDLKARNLPISDKLPPDFTQIVSEWKRKGGVIPSTDSAKGATP